MSRSFPTFRKAVISVSADVQATDPFTEIQVKTVVKGVLKDVVPLPLSRTPTPLEQGIACIITTKTAALPPTAAAIPFFSRFALHSAVILRIPARLPIKEEGVHGLYQAPQEVLALLINVHTVHVIDPIRDEDALVRDAEVPEALEEVRTSSMGRQVEGMSPTMDAVRIIAAKPRLLVNAVPAFTIGLISAATSKVVEVHP